MDEQHFGEDGKWSAVRDSSETPNLKFPLNACLKLGRLGRYVVGAAPIERHAG